MAFFSSDNDRQSFQIYGLLTGTGLQKGLNQYSNIKLSLANKSEYPEAKLLH